MLCDVLVFGRTWYSSEAVSLHLQSQVVRRYYHVCVLLHTFRWNLSIMGIRTQFTHWCHQFTCACDFFCFFFILGFCCFSFCTSSIFFPALVIRLYVLVRRLHVFIHHYDYSNTSIFVIVSFSVINVVVFWFVILTFGFDIFYFFGLQRVSMIPSICKM